MFKNIGRDMFMSRLITSHGGNLSVREGEKIYITRTGSQLGRLSKKDIVEVPVAGTSDMDCEASVELVVHRAIYSAIEQSSGNTSGAIAHAHALYTVLLSMNQEKIEPLDSEAKLFIPRVPVVSSSETIGSPEAAQALAATLTKVPIAVLKGHGPFAYGDTLEEAYRWISVLEYSSNLICAHQQTTSARS